jgi:PDZ domain-containing protein
VVACTALVAAGFAIGAWNLTLPYYAFSGGPVGDAVGAVSVAGPDTYRPAGELLMLTVSGQRVNPFEALVAGLDGDVDLVPVAAVRTPDESDEEFVARNRAAMDVSAETAITVALRRLGYEVGLTSDGVSVLEVVAGAPAASVLEQGDILVEVDGVPVRLVEEVGPIIAQRRVGEVVSVVIRRAGEDLPLDVELAARTDDPAVPMIGITGQALNPRFDFPFDIRIDAGQIGGPSAGMMYTLAVIDLLTPGDLARGHVVAGTGTIDLEGVVGPIGGVRQKVVAAEAAGAEYVLVPQGNYQEALTAKRTRVELVPVETLDQALAFFDGLAPA